MNSIIELELLSNRELPGCGRLVDGVILRISRKWLGWIRSISLTGTLDLSLLEAMSYGNCCLTSDIAECTEVVEDKALAFKKSDVAYVTLRSALIAWSRRSENWRKLALNVSQSAWMITPARR